MKWLALEISSLLLAYSADYFRGIVGKVRKRLLVRDLQTSLFYGIQQRYENELFYNDLDNFLSKNKVISEIIRNCLNAPVSQYSSKSTLVEFYIRKFEEQYPHYYQYHFEIISLLKACFDIVFNSLNRIDCESTQVICNTVKELSGELHYKIDLVLTEVKSLSEKFDRIEHLWSLQPTKETIQFDHKRYIQYLACLYPDYLTSNYLERGVHPCNNQTGKTVALDALLQERNILLLGDAGYGKTYEAITILRNVCQREDLCEVFPIFLPLSEFGHLYNSIFDGILLKLKPFCSGNSQIFLNNLLSSGNILLILDGIDEISKEGDRIKFIAELKNLYQQYNANCYFATSRLNQYHAELSEMKSYFLSPIDHHVVFNKLRQEALNTEIPQSYYQLFENPLFFEIGKTILRQSTLQDHFNRSTLFEKLFTMLYGEWNQQKGIQVSQQLCYSEVLSILGDFSYKSFSQTSYSYIEFENLLCSHISGCEKKSMIGTIILSGIFRITDRVVFTHKLFKEYFAAYHLFTYYPFYENRDLYLSLIKKREWKEVFIFIVGMYKDIMEQDAFLDFVLQNNLPLYVDCIDAKSDLFDPCMCSDLNETAFRYLSLILNTYTTIVSTYFSVISSLFDPVSGDRTPTDRKICIVGALSSDRKHLNYWFDLLPQSEENVILIASDDLPTYHKQHERNALRDLRSIRAYGINLKASELQGDTGRKIALNLIKSELARILENQSLLEDKYLLCEKVADCKRKIKGLQGVNTVDEMFSYLDKEISSVQNSHSDAQISSFIMGGIDIIPLRTILKYLADNNINYSECLLPEPDIDRSELGPCWTWDLYSDQQKVNRISKFFYFHQLSYKEMVETNFPALCSYFSRYLDIPYQTEIGLDLKKGIPEHNFYSDPEIKFYYVASPQSTPVEPHIYFCDKVDLDSNAHERIRQSYLQQGKIAHHITSTCAGFTFTTTSHRTGAHTPLSNYVYDSIKESLEDIFHSLN